MMDKIKNILKEYKKSCIAGAVILLVVLYFIFGGGEQKSEIYIVAKANVEQSVVLSGKIETSDKADLGFADSGRLSRIFVKNNEIVKEGQILAQLEIGDLFAELKIKQLNSKTSNLDLEDAKEELEKVTLQENTKVENAYRTLLTDGLLLIPNSSDSDLGAPVVAGIYDGAEGEYKIIINKKNSTDSDLQLSTFGLEKSKVVINEEGSTKLGTRGLYISFPDDLSSYVDTIWYLDIPNKSSSSYLANYNEYNEVKKSRDLEIKNAKSKYEKLLAENDGGSSVAQSEIQKIQAEIRKNTIYAPFVGRVTNIEKEVGENASVGERVVSILGEEKLEVVLEVSELDVSRLVPGSAIEVSLDAFPNEKFSGILKTINSRETEIEGVPVYEAFVELKSDNRIKTGMSATGTVIIATKNDVLVIPTYLVKKDGNFNTVEVIGGDGEKIERQVTLGLLGTDSMVEVISGLSEGDKIIFLAKN